MKSILLHILLVMPVAGTCQTISTGFIFPSKEGHFDLLSEKGLIQKNQSASFKIRTNTQVDIFEVTVVALNGSIAHSGDELTINVAGENLIYILFLTTDQTNNELNYLDLIGVPIADNPYPYIVVYGDNVPVNPQRGVQGNTNQLQMVLLYDELQGSCKDVFVNQIAVSFTDRKREVGLVRKQANTAFVNALFTRGASPHLEVEVKAESIGCTDENGVLRIISPKIRRSFTYGVTGSNIDKDVAQIISQMNTENKKQVQAEASKDKGNQ